jgi:pSer/pThr/pTyr-binding forkhead associated (FHA) protein
MPRLTLKFKENVISDYTVEKGKSLTIGRRDDNDVIIENLAVSGHHAKIDSVGDGFVLTDLKSKNGCFVNEKHISSHWLKNGDVISIGKHTLLFGYDAGETQPNDPAGEMDQTMVIDTAKHRDMLAKSASSIPEQQAPAPEKEKQAVVGVLSYLAGGEGEVDLNKKLIKIGKDTGSDIIVSGLGVGQTAATISKRPNGYYISFVSGISKVKVNGETLKDSIQLKEFDVIEIGSAKLQFFSKD